MKAWLAIALVLSSPALAAGTADQSYPQAVKVGDLIGHQLIGAKESQPLLGHVEAIEREPNGALAVRVKTWSLLPWGGRSVAVPLAAVSLLNPQLALTGLPPSALASLPSVDAAAPSLPPSDTIEVGLVKPFH